ncbi:MAG: hypothetical protein CFH18_00713 [Alphaproteobacteria bacterium MarineAlpha5_Bin8]|nr:MAG: hypothetical protein CFH17_00067 [Alphaproteobacteria bacterium MarineAlpha5_Bin7]PPR46242.1 MAG: hypothetical protein CFH18_00713 [Alphaproteobacteria bacterium MarineAlpha5_Bin8]PPR54995.1 MAG: hypothetical protein CFH16_00029 [Alphaproteobacteria bacterium MarineAlpha5_Bin6]|tara:strand:+ start:5419 stop:6324 length:906 start_codon:yes stop_codon:yes gene_type:complete
MKTVLIFGGSGFIGQHIARRMAKNGYKVIIPYQGHVDDAKLRFIGGVGQICPIKFRSLSEKIIDESIKESNVIINLKTLWYEKPVSFEKGIYKFNQDLVYLIKNHDQNKLLIFFSGLGTTHDSKSKRTKIIAKTEDYIINNLLNSLIIRPGLVFGLNDNFLRKIMPLIKLSFIIPIFGSGETRVQPVYVDDVAKAVERLVVNKYIGNKIYELYGSENFSYRFLYRFLAQSLGLHRIIFPIPIFLAKVLVYFIQKISSKFITIEQLNLFMNDSLPSNKTATFSDLGIGPQNILQVIKIIIKK